MVRRWYPVAAVIALTSALLSARDASAQALGCYHLPSTVPQFLGYGYGAGRHAPIVHQPSARPDRMQRRMRVPARYGQLAPAPYESIGCYGEWCGMSLPYSAAPVPTLAPAAPTPAASAPRAPAAPTGPEAPAPSDVEARMYGPMLYGPAMAAPPADYGWR